ncbi:hypothetical protein [Neisseria iguanae]|uniref:hypothetical protein n=1 Tax=Neisseria iguanae TaxID=90242 RepID=UPI001FE3EFFF|nr:hypothetical protein [Neisseria iguanae]
MPQNHEINGRKLLDSRGVGTYQKLVIFLCFLIVVMDGFDVVIMGFVGSSLKEVWNPSATCRRYWEPPFSACLTVGSLGDCFDCRKILPQAASCR